MFNNVIPKKGSRLKINPKWKEAHWLTIFPSLTWYDYEISIKWGEEDDEWIYVKEVKKENDNTAIYLSTGGWFLLNKDGCWLYPYANNTLFNALISHKIPLFMLENDQIEYQDKSAAISNINYCSCNTPNMVSNIADFKTFKYCKTCKKEIT